MFSIKHIFINALGTFLSRFLGLFKNIIVNFYFGLADTFWGAFQIVNTFRVFVGEGTINNSFIPIYKKVNEENKSELKYFSLKAFLVVFIISTILVALLNIFSYEITKIVLPGFSKEKLIEASNSLNIMSFAVILISLQSFLAALQISKYDSFISFAFAPVVYNVITILTIALLNKLGYYILSWSVITGSIGMLLFQLIFLLREIKGLTKIEIKKVFKFDTHTKSFIVSFISIIGISLIVQLNSIVSRFFGSFFEGVVAALTNAYILIQTPLGIFSVAISVVGLNTFSEHFSQNNIEKAKEASNQSIKLLNLLVIPVAVTMIVLSEELTKIIYRDISGIFLGSEGKYSKEALKLTTELFFIYSISTYFLGITSLITRISYARGDVKTPVINSLLNLLTNVIANTVIFFTLKNYLGIPISFLIANLVSTVHILMSEIKYIGNKKEIIEEFFKIISTSLISASIIKLLGKAVKLPDTYIISFIWNSTLISLSILTPLFLSSLLNIKTIQLFKKAIKKT
ncbi:MAG: lipid II flippase MurJ [Brevinematia bacterium]